MEKLIEIVKSGLDVGFLDSDGHVLQIGYDIVRHILKNIESKKDGKMVLVLASERAYERAKRLLDEESGRVGIDYSV
jgi:hypothetical protein